METPIRRQPVTVRPAQSRSVGKDAGELPLTLFLLDNTAELYRIPGFAALGEIRVVQRILATGAAIYMALFVVRYLRMAERTPVLARMQWMVIWIYLAVAVGSCIPVIGLAPQWSLIGNLTMVASSIIEIIAAVKGAIAGHRSSRMFLCSWAPLFFFLGWRVLELSLGWPARPAAVRVPRQLRACRRADDDRPQRPHAQVQARARCLGSARAPRSAYGGCGAHSTNACTPQHSKPGRARSRWRCCSSIWITSSASNDDHGHNVGDECLREVARRIRSTLRFGDVLGRYGGEEFVIGLPRMQTEAASAMAERVRQAVGSRPIACNGIEVRITISVGLAMLEGGLAGFDAAIKRADRALYVSKRAGRDRVSVL